ncbi:MAG: GAF domain-containing protein [Myxococcota bacterium]
MGSDENDKEQASDLPVDLVKERETFVRSFLRKGVELTEQLLKENVTLREELAEVRENNARLRSQIKSDDAIRELIEKIEALENEKNDLLARSSQLEARQSDGESRYSEIESELNDLANLYIASFQLHASLSPRRVVRHLMDMAGQLVGASRFAIYIVAPGASEAVPVASEGIDAGDLFPVPLGSGPVGEACLTGIESIPDSFEEGTVDAPMVLLPLMVEGRPVGVLSVVSMLEQKSAWASVDRELFKLIGAHAGHALAAANLYASLESPFVALEGLPALLKKRGSTLFPPEDNE